MTGITADLFSLAGVADRSYDTAGHLTTGAYPGGGTPPVFALPQAAHFLAAFTAARERQAGVAREFARFYADAGDALTRLGDTLADREDAAARSFGRTGGAAGADGPDGSYGGRS